MKPLIAGNHILLAAGLSLFSVGCQGDDPVTGVGPGESSKSACIISSSELADGGVEKDGIPALTDPPFVGPSEATYLDPESRVIGLLVEGRPIAVPHNILWSHEIVNLNTGDGPIAVTYCPLTGSSIAFDRSAVGGAEFGVSGLLFRNNLTMYDRNSSESLWPQMMRQAGCGERVGTRLDEVAVMEMNWSGWQELFPTTTVVSANTGFERGYRAASYPYGDYEREDNARLLFRQEIDPRRLPKERVLGIPVRNGGIALPFDELNKEPLRAVRLSLDARPLVVFWSRRHAAAVAYRSDVDDKELDFVVANGRIVDGGTGSEWRLDGRAMSGPMVGKALQPITESYVAFWFAWAEFQPETTIWSAG